MNTEYFVVMRFENGNERCTERPHLSRDAAEFYGFSLLAVGQIAGYEVIERSKDEVTH